MTPAQDREMAQQEDAAETMSQRFEDDEQTWQVARPPEAPDSAPAVPLEQEPRTHRQDMAALAHATATTRACLAQSQDSIRGIRATLADVHGVPADAEAGGGDHAG